MLIRQTQEEDAAAGELQMRTELEAITLSSCCVVRLAEVECFENPIQLSLTYRGTGRTAPSGFNVEAQFLFVAEDSSEPPRRTFKIECVFKVEYKVKGEQPISEMQLNAFSRTNAIFNCWPYAREFVQSTTARMGERVPPLPYLRIAGIEQPALVVRTASTQKKPKKAIRKRSRK